MNTKFKIGDKVRCIDNTHRSILNLKDIYIVKDVTIDSDEVEYLHLFSDDIESGLYAWRFEHTSQFIRQQKLIEIDEHRD